VRAAQGALLRTTESPGNQLDKAFAAAAEMEPNPTACQHGASNARAAVPAAAAATSSGDTQPLLWDEAEVLSRRAGGPTDVAGLSEYWVEQPACRFCDGLRRSVRSELRPQRRSPRRRQRSRWPQHAAQQQQQQQHLAPAAPP
jgi:hypothetical protein